MRPPRRNLPRQTIPTLLIYFFEEANVSKRVWFDDGRIGGVIDRTEPGCAHYPG